MSKAFMTGFATLAACALFACAGGESVDQTTEPSKETNATEPTLLADNPSEDAPRVADEREDLASANGATARAISYNHPQPHTLTISALDLASGRGGTFYLSEGGGALGKVHTHEIVFTAQQLSELRDGAELTVESGAGGLGGAHTHTVTVSRR